MIPPKTRELLENLAAKYETFDFCTEDPSQFLRRYTEQPEVEAASFFTALMSFGSRKQFIPKVKLIFDAADRCGGFLEFVKGNKWEGGTSPWEEKSGNNGKGDFWEGGTIFPEISGTEEDLSRKFYRFYSFDDIFTLFGELSSVIKNYGSLGEAVRSNVEKLKVLPEKISSDKPSNKKLLENTLPDSVLACKAIQMLFQKSKIVSKGEKSANKRLYMFLRWMTRTNSPVDLGLWNWLKPSSLLMPLDTHVMQESINLGLIPKNSSCSLKTALLLTDILKEVWPEDPVKGDFALFGLGVNNEK